MRKLKLYSLILLLALSFALPTTFAQRRVSKAKATSTVSLAATRGANLITAAQLKDYLSFIASDEMEGRDTPSRGLDTTAKFIAMNLSRWGFKPAGDDGSYLQRIALQRNQLDAAASHAEINGQRFNFGDDFLPNAVSATISGPLVYVGHGWMIKSKNIDSYHGVDVKDKIVVVFGEGLPKGVSQSDLTGTRGEDWANPLLYAQRHGAKGVLAIPDFSMLLNWDRSRQRATSRGNTVVEKFQTPANTSIPAIWLSARMATALFQGEKYEATALMNRGIAGDTIEPFELSTGKNVSFTIAVKPDKLQTQNVVAVWEGSDPALKNEYVALGAHYDHIGIATTPVNGDSINNGADDDGSGTTALLAMAEALAHAKSHPKRSVLFVWHAGEEKGLWGSRYFTEYPTIPLDHIVTQINIDMIGRSKKEGDTNPRNKDLSGPNEIYVIGSKMMSTELGELTDAVNKSYLNVTYDYRYDDPSDPNRFFFRSDHYNYARKGIPIVFFFDGVHEDYHRPGDSADKIDYQKMEKVARTVYMTLWEVANRPTPPKVDKQLPAQLMQRN
jgi:Zn-dependent M28 family amino/carboxypeptidase